MKAWAHQRTGSVGRLVSGESSLIVPDKIIHRTFRQILSERNIWGYARILWWSWYLVFCICYFPELMMNSIYSYLQLSFVSSAIGFHSNLWDKTSIKIVQFSLDIQGSDIEQNDAYRIAKERWAFPWDFFFFPIGQTRVMKLTLHHFFFGSLKTSEPILVSEPVHHFSFSSLA